MPSGYLEFLIGGGPWCFLLAFAILLSMLSRKGCQNAPINIAPRGALVPPALDGPASSHLIRPSSLVVCPLCGPSQNCQENNVSLHKSGYLSRKKNSTQKKPCAPNSGLTLSSLLTCSLATVWHLRLPPLDETSAVDRSGHWRSVWGCAL